MKKSLHSFRSSRRAFSLVEVVVALALFAFCMIVLIGLLPEGLMTASNAREQSAAANLAQEISTGIRNAATNSSGNYQPVTPSGNFTNLVWTLGGSKVSGTYNFTLGGIVLATTTERQLTAEVRITPPASTISAGTAFVSVAWPGQAQWSSSTTNWNNAVGSVNTWITFIPRQ